MGEFACYMKGCAHRVCFTGEVEARLRRTHETFYCPAGHPQGFYGKTEQERRIDALEAEVARLRRDNDWLRSDRDDLRVTLHRCRWVGCEYEGKSGSTGDFRDLWAHMRAAHGMPTLRAIRSEEPAA